jgi:hypothetical protein
VGVRLKVWADNLLLLCGAKAAGMVAESTLRSAFEQTPFGNFTLRTDHQGPAVAGFDFVGWRFDRRRAGRRRSIPRAGLAQRIIDKKAYSVDAGYARCSVDARIKAGTRL